MFIMEELSISAPPYLGVSGANPPMTIHYTSLIANSSGLQVLVPRVFFKVLTCESKRVCTLIGLLLQVNPAQAVPQMPQPKQACLQHDVHNNGERQLNFSDTGGARPSATYEER